MKNDLEKLYAGGLDVKEFLLNKEKANTRKQIQD